MNCQHCRANMHDDCEGGECDCVKCLLKRQGTDEQQASKLTPDEAKARLLEILSPLVPELVTLVGAIMQDKRPEFMPLNAVCVRGNRLIDLVKRAGGSEFATYLEPQNRYLVSWERLTALIEEAAKRARTTGQARQ